MTNMYATFSRGGLSHLVERMVWHYGELKEKYDRLVKLTNYIVSLKQSETARKTLDEKIRELCVKEVMAEGFADSDYPAAG